MSLQTIIEIGISLIFAWLVLSIAAMYVQEWIVGHLAWRSDMLETTVRNMLADPALADQFYDHPLIQGLYSGKEGDHKPSYIPSQQFVLALFDIVMNAGTESSLLQQELFKLHADIDRLKTDKKARAEAQFQLAMIAVRKGLATQAGQDVLNQTVEGAKAEVSKLAEVSPELQPAVEQALANVKVNKDQVDGILAEFQAQNSGLTETPTLDQIRVGVAALAVSQPQLSQALGTLLQGVEEYATKEETALATARTSVEKWFNDSMDRLSGWYKRRSQGLALVIGIAVAVALNGDTLALAQQLWREPVVREALVAQAQSYVNQQSTTPSQPPTAEQLAQFEAQFSSLDIPIGWIGNPTPLDNTGKVPGLNGEPARACTLMAGSNSQVYGFQVAGECYPIINAPYLNDLTGWLLKLFGLLVSGVAAAQGAPFWFDILKKIINIRSSGANPAETAPAAG